MRITVVGAGAMGTLMAARLSSAMASGTGGAVSERPERVILYGRPSPHLEAIQRDGVRLTERDGTTHTIPVQVTTEPADVAGSELIIVLVKSWATAESVKPLRSHLTRDAVVLTLQNGLGNAAQLRSALLHDGVRPHVWLGVTTQAALRTEPGCVTHSGEGITVIGRRSSEVNTRLQEIAATLTSAGIPTTAVDDIHRWVWRKLAVNAAINPVTALADVPNCAVRKNHDLQNACRLLASEAAAVASARGLALDEQQVMDAVNDVAEATGDNRSSMLIDLENGLRTEIDAINGAIVKEAHRRGIPAPANQLMVSLIRARASRQERQGRD
ncbi:MAG TPA: 2-dehydropantoate 2-reductase [Thermomicrobiales bacterium]|nr:2-dehydropantoate 2-reductase [Thermomicrobiales bacterium]